MLFLSFFAVAGLVGSPLQRPAPTAPPPAAPTLPERGTRGPPDDSGPPVLMREDVEQRDGVAGELPPAAGKLEFAVTSLDQDTTGRSRLDLCGFAPFGTGYCVLASDQRDGTRNFILQRLDADLEALGPPERLDALPSGMGQGDGSLALASESNPGAVWLDSGDRGRTLRGRTWDHGPEETSITWSMGLPVDPRPDTANEVNTMAPRPALLWTPSLRAVVWNTRGRILLQEFDPLGAESGPQQLIGRRTQLATGGPHLAIDAQGAFACAYNSPGATVIYLRLNPELSLYVDSGPGRLHGFAADSSAVDGGWWLLLYRQGRLVLRHLERSGATDRTDLVVFEGPLRSAELAVGPRGACVLLQPMEGGLEAHWSGGGESGDSFSRVEIRDSKVSVLAARVAVRGERFAFAWTEWRAGAVDLLVRASDHGGIDLGESRELLKGTGTADQERPAAAMAGEFGAVAWVDYRFGGPVIAARGLTARNKLGEREVFLPVARGPAEQRAQAGKSTTHRPGNFPAIALQPSGSGMVSWIAAGAIGATVYVQAIEISADGTLRATEAAREVELEPIEAPPLFPPALIALRDGRSFSLSWVRATKDTSEGARASAEDGRTEVRLARLDLNGLAVFGPRTAGKGSRCAHPALTQLDDGRIALAWDSQPRARERRLAARIFSERLEPEQRELFFETMWRGSDYLPAIAPAESGFALAWTSGEDGDPDVFARVFHSDGRPRSRPLALTPCAGAQSSPSLCRAADGSFVAVWEDNLSDNHLLLARRFSTKGSLLGPTARLRFGPEPRHPNFRDPRTVALADGRLFIAGSHAVEGKGREIGLCILGEAWDQIEGR